MDLYKVVVSVEGRDVTTQVKAGVLASVETGSLVDGVRAPRSKITTIVEGTRKGPMAWVQIASFDRDGTAKITHEGWISSGVFQLPPVSAVGAAKASLARELQTTPEMIKCQENAEFGTDACCTSNGNGCYVRCCGGCCSDPVGCPGAGCCP